jgi:hypothetical protein
MNMNKTKLFFIISILLLTALQVFSLNIYVDDLNVIGPSDELSFSISNYGYGEEEAKTEDITVSIYKMEDAFSFVSRDMPLSEANDIIKAAPLFTYRIQATEGWKREGIPADFFPEIGSYFVVFWKSGDDEYCCVERTNTAGIAIDFGDYVQLEVWDSLSGKVSEFGDIFTGKEKVHLGSLNNPEARRIDKKDIADELVIVNAPSGRAVVSVDLENYIESYNTNLVFLSERPIYRPGDTINVKGYLYNRKTAAFEAAGIVTVTLTDPMGTRLLLLDMVTDERGGFEFSYETSEDAVRGHYDVMIAAEDRNFYRYIEVSDYQKPTFTVEVSNIKEVYGIGEQPVFDVNATYYYGQPIDRGIVHTTVNLMPDYSRNFETKTLDIRSKEMHSGNATDIVRIKAQDVEHYSVEFNVVDKTGREVSEHVFFKYVPSDVVLKTEQWQYWHNLNNGSVRGEFSAEAIFDSADISGREMEFEVIRKKNSVYSKVVKTDSEGTFHFDFDPIIPGYYTLRIVDTAYPQNRIEKTFFVYASDYRYSTTEKLDLIRNQESYRAGDFVELDLISVFRELNAYVIVDFGNTLMTKKLKVKDNTAQMSFVIPADVNRDKIRVQIFSYFGGEEISKTYEIPVKIERFDMNCELRVPEKARPGEDIAIGVALRDNDGTDMNGVVTLNVIDQALIDLYGDDEWELVLGSLSRPPYNYYIDYFNQYYNFARLFSFNTLEYEDADTLAQTKRAASKTGVKVRSDFSDSALWIPGVVVDGNTTFEMKLPENLTTWRTRAIAIGDKGKRTYSADSFIATLPVTVNAVFPKFLITGDTIDLGMNVGNYSGEDLSFEIVFESEGVQEKRLVDIPDQSNEIYWFEYTVPQVKSGEKITFKLGAYGQKDGELVEAFSDAMEEELIVNGREFEINTGAAGIITRDKVLWSYQPEVNSTVTLTMSADLEGELIDALTYLIRYPYGCTEQTISSFLPSLAFLSLRKDVELNEEQQAIFAEIPDITEAALKKLYSYQNYEGAWGWWKGGNTDQFMTAYVMYTYYQLLQLGYDVNMSSYDRGSLALKNLMEDADERLPFAEYVTAMIWPSYSMLLTDRDSLSSKLFMALLMVQRGQDEVASRLLDEIVEEGSSFNGQFKVNFDNTTYFINDLQMNALLFDLMNRLEYNAIEMTWLFNYLYNNKTGEYWRSTKDSAFVVMALSGYLSSSDEFDYRINLNLLKSLASEGHIPETIDSIDSGDTKTYTFAIEAGEIINLEINGESGIMWKVRTSELWAPEVVNSSENILSRDLVVKNQLKMLDEEGELSYKTVYVPIDNGIIPDTIFPNGTAIDLETEPENIYGFRLEKIDDSHYYRRLIVNGRDTGVMVSSSSNLIGMTATSLTLDRNPFTYDEGAWTIVFRKNDRVLRIGDEVRSIIRIKLPVSWRWAALEEYLPSCFVQDEDYGTDYYAGKYYSTRSYLSTYYTDHVEDRYDRTTSFMSYISERDSVYMNHYKIIATGEFIVPPLKLFEMYNPGNDIVAPGLSITVEK